MIWNAERNKIITTLSVLYFNTILRVDFWGEVVEWDFPKQYSGCCDNSWPTRLVVQCEVPRMQCNEGPVVAGTTKSTHSNDAEMCWGGGNSVVGLEPELGAYILIHVHS